MTGVDVLKLRKKSKALGGLIMDVILIKEAADILGVEPHVLRYWEEELELEIKRNSMGHRYYDQKDIKLFSDVKELKKRGLTLKDIKRGIENKKKILKDGIGRIESENKNEKMTDDTYKKEAVDEAESKIRVKKSDTAGNEQEKEQEKKIVDFKTVQLQNIMNRIIANALNENKDIITSSIKEEITGDVMRQFDAVMREKEEREEERFKRLDSCLRQLQLANQEIAAAKAKGWFGKRKR